MKITQHIPLQTLSSQKEKLNNITYLFITQQQWCDIYVLLPQELKWSSHDNSEEAN